MLKRYLLVFVIFLFSSQYALANDLSTAYDITNLGQIHSNHGEGTKATILRPSENSKNNYLYNNKNFPICGGDPGSIFYLDLKSCNYFIQDGVAYISCLIYCTGGGVGPNGGPAKVTTRTIRFATYKSNKRVIKLLSCIDDKTGENITKFVYDYDGDFLRGLFWQVAKHLNINQYLD